MFSTKKIFALLSLYTVIYACSSEVNYTDKDYTSSMEVRIDSIDFDKFVVNYTPHHLDMSEDLNDTLRYFNIEAIFDKTNNQTKSKWVHILLLKQYLYHVKNANQGYDLYTMRKGQTAIIINYFIEANSFKPEGEFLNSGSVVDKVLKNEGLSQDKNILTLLREIQKEEQRILTKPAH